jgi:single-stranded-DNA-specific exonuclease
MRYKLVNGSSNNIRNPKETVLINRGIANPKEYLHLDDSVLHHWSLLENIEEAKDCLFKHIEDSSPIHIVVDCDCDGNTSAAIMYKYLKLMDSNMQLSYSIHTGKQHGLSEDIIIPEDVKLVIMPDAGTNDVEQCKKLQDKGIDVIILDHHIMDAPNPHAIIVNSQIGEYPNKALSGVGVTYKFLQAIDESTWNDYAENFLDLVSLGLIGDCMDIKSYETKRLIDKGLRLIKNKFFAQLIEKQSYSMSNTVNIINVQWYIVPQVNAMIRSGDYDEKDLMFRAFIEQDETFKYKPRRKSKDDPEPEEIDEDIYTRAARLCSNAKGRQTKSKDKGSDKIDEVILKHGLDKNKIVFANVTGLLDENMTGMVAIKVAEKYNKPCLLLRKREDGTYAGSGRNIDNSPIESLKDFLTETGLFTFVTGHDNAFGAGISKDNIPLVIERINEMLKDVDFSHCYEVDFILDVDDLDVAFVKAMDELKHIYGQGVKEGYVTIKNISIDKDKLELIGKEKTTWKFLLNDEVAFVKFKCKEDDVLLSWITSWDETESVTIDVIGKVSVNSFGSILTPQVIVQEYELRKE